MKIKTKPHGFYRLLILSLVFLFNPNINMIDILPDCVGYFILSHIFLYASDCASHFEEARIAFKRLAWLNVAKLPAFIVIIFIRTGNTVDNDVYALMSLSFAAIECVLSYSAIKNIFEALLHLGQRTDAHSLITPYPVSKSRTFAPEGLRTLSYIFVTAKCIFYSVPDLFLLTQTNTIGGLFGRSSTLKFYPFAIIFSLVFGFVIGSIWLSRTVKYIRAIKREGLFSSALASIASEDFEFRFETKRKLRLIFSLLFILCASVLFSIDFTVDNFEGLDLLPDFIYGILFTIAIYKMSKHAKQNSLIIIFGALYSLSSLLSLIFSVRFFDGYSFREILEGNLLAKQAYTEYIAFAIAEFIALVIMLIISSGIIKSFIYSNTGIHPTSKRYNTMDTDYHKAFLRRGYTVVVLGILCGALKLCDTILNGNVQALFSDPTDVTQPVIMTSPFPWFGLVVFAVSFIYVGYTFYFSTILKEECEMKYLNNL